MLVHINNFACMKLDCQENFQLGTQYINPRQSVLHDLHLMSQALSDLSLREFRGSERVSNINQDELVLYQNEFFSEVEIDRHESKRRKNKTNAHGR